MADTQTAPAGVTPGARDVPVPGPLASSDEIDLADATQGFLNLMDPPEETPEEKAMRLDFIEWAKNQPWNIEEHDQCSRADSV